MGLIGTSNWCRGLTRQEVAAVEFNYDGSFSERGFTNLSSRPKHHLLIVAVDAKGNVSETWYSLAEVSPYEIATIEGPLGYHHFGGVFARRGPARLRIQSRPPPS